MRSILDIVLIVLAVDFASGFFHWLEDRYGKPDWPITGRWITQPNMLHHEKPCHFTKNSWLKSADVLLVMAVFLASIAWLFEFMTWELAVFIAIGINANEIHKWNHLPSSQRPRWVNLLQKLRVLQSARHHARHHGGNKDTHYCVITDFVNPVVDSLRLWRGLEWIIKQSTGVSCRT